jgi:hypothetical protein
VRVAVIGTAGRDKDGEVKLDGQTWSRMKAHFFHFLGSLDREVDLVSGGAPWADHLAVAAYLEGKARSLTIFAPAEFEATPNMAAYVPDSSVKFNPGARLNELFGAFSAATGSDRLLDINDALLKGARVIVVPGFHPRNDKVAWHGEYLIAYSFGHDIKVRPDTPAERVGIPSGGTAYTWNKSVARVKQSVDMRQFDTGRILDEIARLDQENGLFELPHMDEREVQAIEPDPETVKVLKVGELPDETVEAIKEAKVIKETRSRRKK